MARTSGFCVVESAGSVFHIGTDGSGGVLFQFGSTSEQNPMSGLTLATYGNFYGVFENGGSNDFGVLYRITAEGVYTAVYNFHCPHSRRQTRSVARLPLHAQFC